MERLAQQGQWRERASETIKPLLLGKDPLEIEVHFQQMSSMMYNYMAHIPTVSGIDIALWDLAGKILGRSVSELLGGGFREEIAMYSHGIGVDLWTRALSCVGSTYPEHARRIHSIQMRRT